MKKKFIYITFALLLMSFIKTDRVEKKSNSILKKIFKEIVLEKKAIPHTSSNKDEKWYSISNKQTKELLGYMETTSSIGKMDKFNFMVVFNPDKSIKKVRVIIYREDHGGEIASKRWLKQFEGKASVNSKTLHKEIDGISGATLSCNSITKEISKSLVTIQKLK